MYQFNYIYYHLFNVICNSFVKMDNLVFEFVSQVVSPENHLAFLLAAVNQVMNRTIAWNETFNNYLAL